MSNRCCFKFLTGSRFKAKNVSCKGGERAKLVKLKGTDKLVKLKGTDKLVKLKGTDKRNFK